MENNRLIELPLGLEGKLFRSPMPFAAFDEKNTLLEEYLAAGVTHVVMLTEPGEDLIRASRDLTRLYTQNKINPIHYPIRDFGSPDDVEQLKDKVRQVVDLVENGQTVAVHCFAGRGRTGMFLGIVAKVVLGLDGDEAIAWVRELFPAIETEEQEELVRVYKP